MQHMRSSFSSDTIKANDIMPNSEARVRIHNSINTNDYVTPTMVVNKDNTINLYLNRPSQSYRVDISTGKLPNRIHELEDQALSTIHIRGIYRGQKPDMITMPDVVTYNSMVKEPFEDMVYDAMLRFVNVGSKTMGVQIDGRSWIPSSVYIDGNWCMTPIVGIDHEKVYDVGPGCVLSLKLWMYRETIYVEDINLLDDVDIHNSERCISYRMKASGK